MRVVIAGGHGQVARHLIAELALRGDAPVGLIRNPDHALDLAALGATSIVVDLERVSLAELAEQVLGADAIVFAAGAGPGSGAARKLTVDLDGAVLLMEAAQLSGIRRYIMVSAAHTDAFDPSSDEVMQVYLRAKSTADRVLRDSGLDWTIVRPGALTNAAPTGRIRIADDVGSGSISRADVARILAECLRQPHSIHAQFEVVTGDVPTAEAIAQLRG
ncbi:MAG: putative nucleoside-diphosphate-sugar epimerase [Thermoleophilia bacterium]|nr:putative nucleoside-diphosphate-sugar epimerase [Thermoleophilia bacterium]MCZ4495930.1 putative nucleoside-diphosphate-sugar epimerase [Thermoleophilia bacterium]